MNGALPSGGLVLDPILPVPIIVLSGAALLFFTVRLYLKVGSSAGRGRNVVLTLFRLAGIVLVLLLLLQPSRRDFLPPPTTERITVLGLDTSLSMKQRDVEGASRIDAARNLLMKADVVAPNGTPGNARQRLFEFNEGAQPVEKSVLDLVPAGKTTRFHKSISTMLNTSAAGEALNGLVLLTDGHDFELVNPVKTGTAARSRQVPIYAVAFGAQGKVRDVSVRITSFQPYCYVRQKARISAVLRLIGCELEDLTVQLLRDGQIVQSRKLNADEFQELPVEFEVTEPTVGQYEYEVRVLPLDRETDTANNSALTYLNVIDQQIRVLIVEGDPYWDTTFLQRSLMRNDKFDVDALIRYGRSRVRAIRKTPGLGELHMPETLDQFAAYDAVILGREVDQVMSAAQIGLLDRCVQDRGATLIFSRGRAFQTPLEGGLEPVVWSDKYRERVHLDVTAEGRALSALSGLNDQAGGPETLPDLLTGKTVKEIQPLTSTLALESNRDNRAPVPAIVHRRYGRGQVVSIGVEGLWRWSLNAKAEGPNSPFDRYWDQMILWLLAGRDFIPNRQFSFRPDVANILLGEKVHFRLTMRQPDPKVTTVPVTVYYGDASVGRVNLTRQAPEQVRLTAEFLPERIGRYRAVASFPDGTTQESRFIVYTENLEETEVTADALYLRRLCESSGGRLIDAAELPKLLKELAGEKTDLTPKTRLTPVWNEAWVFYLAGLLFGLDWFLRRRWGLC